jgi:hypothetical protein
LEGLDLALITALAQIRIVDAVSQIVCMPARLAKITQAVLACRVSAKIPGCCGEIAIIAGAMLESRDFHG